MTHYAMTPQVQHILQTPMLPFMLDVNTHLFLRESIQNAAQIENGKLAVMMCAELAGDFHLGDSRQLTDKSLLPFDLVS